MKQERLALAREVPVYVSMEYESTLCKCQFISCSGCNLLKDWRYVCAPKHNRHPGF